MKASPGPVQHGFHGFHDLDSMVEMHCMKFGRETENRVCALLLLLLTSKATEGFGFSVSG